MIDLTVCILVIATVFLITPSMATPSDNDRPAPMETLAENEVIDPYEKRAKMSMGFVGMRGKKLTNMDVEDDYLGPPGIYTDFDKRAPARGFHGMRGKKARSMGFMGMRGKKDFFQNPVTEETQDAETIDGLLNLLLDERERDAIRSKRFTRLNAWRTRGAKKAPLLGFVGMRGKRDPSIALGSTRENIEQEIRP